MSNRAATSTPLGRLLGEDHLDLAAEERPRERDLLLVAAGERLHGLLDRRHPDAEAPREVVDRAAFAATLEDAEPPEAAKHLDRRVHPDAEDGEAAPA